MFFYSFLLEGTYNNIIFYLSNLRMFVRLTKKMKISFLLENIISMHFFLLLPFLIFYKLLLSSQKRKEREEKTAQKDIQKKLLFEKKRMRHLCLLSFEHGEPKITTTTTAKMKQQHKHNDIINCATSSYLNLALFVLVHLY